MSKPRLLDAFSGAGGAAKGYQRAGFYVVGVDHKPQPRYCGDEFVLGDALEYIKAHGHEFDAIHASPPCQAFTQMSAKWRGRGTAADEHPDLLTPTLYLLRTSGHRLWIVENVPGARRRMRHNLLLHGGMFRLGVHRPRLFESSVALLSAFSQQTKFPIGVYGTKPDGRTTYRYRNNGNYKGKSLIRAAKSIEEARVAMGIDWMTWEEIREAIPPAYTYFVGCQLMVALGHEPRVWPPKDVPMSDLPATAGIAVLAQGLSPQGCQPRPVRTPLEDERASESRRSETGTA